MTEPAHDLAAAAGGDPLAALAATAAALVAGLLILAVWFRSGGGAPSKPVATPVRPPPVKVDADADVDDGRKRVTIFFGTQTGTAEGFAKVAARSDPTRMLARVYSSLFRCPFCLTRCVYVLIVSPWRRRRGRGTRRPCSKWWIW
jgi:hypothetical protein